MSDGGRGVPALAHDFLAVRGGAESALLELARLLPTAEIHTTFYDPESFEDALRDRVVRTWPLNRSTTARKRFRQLLPLYPLWFSRVDLRGHPLVLSSSIAFTHAVRRDRTALHVAYVYTPIRYAWDLETYLEGSSLPAPARLGARLLRPALQRWDRRAGARPDVVVAISATVAGRIRRHWGRDAEVIFPAVDVAGMPMLSRRDGFLLVASRMLAYRRLDLAIAAANRLGRPLVVVGDGPERAALERMAGPTVEFRGWVDRAALVDLFARCDAYLVPGVEDFGIAPVEAMAAGKPVIGVKAGGVAETVLDGRTGVLFEKQTVESLVAAIERLDAMAVDPEACRTRAEAFSVSVFHERWRALLSRNGVDPSLYSAA